MKIFTWKHRLLTFASTITVVGLFVLVGYLIGKALGNIPLFIMLGVIISYPFSLFALTKVLNRDVDKEGKK